MIYGALLLTAFPLWAIYLAGHLAHTLNVSRMAETVGE